MTEILDETEAALNEGLAPMPEDLLQLRDEWIVLKDQIDMLNERKDEIKVIISKRLEDDGLQGYTWGGKVRARISSVTTPRLDSKKLKETMPHIWNQFIKITKSERFTMD